MASEEDMVISLTCNLPGEIVMNILSQLPVQSLMRFNCVKKSWNSLFKNPIFIKIHTDHLHHTTKNDESFLISSHDYLRTEISLIHSESNEWIPLGIYEKEQYEIVGCSKGLVCLRTYDTNGLSNNFMLLNPATSEAKFTYKRDWDNLFEDKCEKREAFGFGFGYDEEHADFKIMSIMQNRHARIISFCHVYSLNTNSWKRVEMSLDFRLAIPDRGHRKYSMDVELYNYLHWPAYDSSVIGRFNLGSEDFSSMLLPNKSNIYDTHLLKWRQEEQLAAVYHVCGHQAFEVWTMVKYGDVDSWMKELTFMFPSGVKATVYCSRRNGDFVCSSHNREDPVLLYLKNENNFKDLGVGVGKKVIDESYQVVVYEKTLMRVNGKTLINGTSKFDMQK